MKTSFVFIPALYPPFLEHPFYSLTFPRFIW